MTEIEDQSATSSPTEPETEESLSRKARRAKQHKRSSRRGARLREWAIALILAAIVALGVRTFVFQAFYVPSTSMYPTLQVGDRIIVDKFLFTYHDLRRGDIVVFHRPPTASVCGPTEDDLVKRVIGVPGDTITSRGNTIYIDSRAITEPYLPRDTPLGPKPITFKGRLGPGEYFVMGDNRSVSCDSRYFGPIKGSSIVGRVVLLIWRGGHPAFHIF